MNDFSTAIMLRLIARACEAEGLPPPPVGAVRDARLPLSTKRELLASLHEQIGMAGLLRVGDQIHTLPDEPAGIALRLARGPDDMLDRWQRLEAYVHSHHRIRRTDDGRQPGRMELRHLSLRPGEPPLTAEHLLVAGVLAALMDLSGARGLTMRVGNAVRRDGVWQVPEQTAGDPDAADWVLEWRPETGSDHDRIDSPPANVHSRLADRVRSAIATDPSRRWRIGDVARALALSTRSLQRHLATEGSSFTDLVAAARLAFAATLLTGTRHGTAEIGYAAGFADQAHFTRAFRRHTALTPEKYRRQFASL